MFFWKMYIMLFKELIIFKKIQKKKYESNFDNLTLIMIEEYCFIELTEKYLSLLEWVLLSYNIIIIYLMGLLIRIYYLIH